MFTLPETFSPGIAEAGLRSMQVGDQLLLSPDRFQPGDIQDWLARLSESAMTLTLSQIETIQKGEVLTGYVLTGHPGGGWPIPGISEPFQIQSLSVRMTADEKGNSQFELENISATLTTLHGPLHFESGNIEERGCFSFRTVDGQTLTPLVPFLGGALRPENFPPLIGEGSLPELPGLAVSGLEFWLLPSEEMVTDLAWHFTLNDLAIEGIPAGLRKLQMQIATQIGNRAMQLEEGKFTQPQSAHGFYFSGELTLDQAYNIHISTLDVRHAVIEVVPVSGAFPGPADLLTAIGAEEAGKTLSESIAQVPIIDGLKLTGIRFVVDLKQKNLLSANLMGSLDIRDHLVDFQFAYPAMRLRAALSSDTPIELGALISDAFPAGSGLSSDLSIEVLSLDLRMKPFGMRMTVAANDLIAFEWGKVSPSFDYFYLTVLLSKNSSPQGTVSVGLTLAGVDVEFQASNEETHSQKGWHFKGEVAGEEPIQLDALIKDIAEVFGVNPPEQLPSMEISDIKIEFHTETKQFKLAFKAKVEGEIGPFKEISGAFSLNSEVKKGKRVTKVELKGTAKLEKHEFNLSIDLGTPEWKVEASWKGTEGIDVLTLVRSIDPTTKASDVSQEIRDHFTLTEVKIGYLNKTKNAFLSMKTKGGGIFQISALKSGGKWGFLFAIGYKQVTDIEEPGLKKHLETFAGTLSVKELWLVGGILPAGLKKPPKLPEALPKALDLKEFQKSLAVLGTINLTSGKGEMMQQLGKHLPGTDVFLMGRVFSGDKGTGIELKVAWEGDLVIPNEGEKPLVITDTSLSFKAGTMGVRLQAKGKMKFHLDELPVELSVNLLLSNAGVQVGFAVDFGKDGLSFQGLEGLYLDSVAMSLGITFAPAGVVVGLQGGMHLTGQKRNANRIGIVLAFSGPVPNPRYFLLMIREIDLSELMNQFQPKNRNRLTTGVFKASNLALYWSQGNVPLPDGTESTGGFGFHGEIQIQDWKAFARVEVSASGFVGEAAMNPVNLTPGGIPILSIIGKGKKRTILELYDPKYKSWDTVDITEPLPENAVTRPRTIVDKGGPYVYLSSMSSPYVNLDFKVMFLGMMGINANAYLTQEGFEFSLQAFLKPLIDIQLECSMNGKEGMSATGSIEVGLKHKAFLKEIRITLEASVAVKVTSNPRDFKFEIDGYFNVMGKKVRLFKFRLPQIPVSIAQIPGFLLETFVKNLWDGIKHQVEKILKGPDKGYRSGGGQAIRAGSKKRIAATAPLNQLLAEWQEAVRLPTKKELKAKSKKIRKPKEMKALAQSIVEEVKVGELEMTKMHQILANRVAATVEAGKARRALEVQNMDREIQELKDAKGKVRGAIKAVWQAEEEALYQLWVEAHKGDPRKGKLRKKSRKPYTDAVAATALKVSQLGIDPDPEKGYSNKKGRISSVALSHHAPIIQQEVQTDLEVRFIIESAEQLARELKTLKAQKKPLKAPLLLKPVNPINHGQ